MTHLLGRNRVNLIQHAVERGLLNPNAELLLSNSSLLTALAGLGAVDTMRYLIFDPNEQRGIGTTRLLGAWGKQHERAALFLIEQVPGCDVNLRGPEGITPLISAAQDGLLRVMRALVARGADVDAMVRCYPAIVIATIERQEEASVYLIEEAGASWAMPIRALSLFELASRNQMPRLLQALVRQMRRDGELEVFVQRQLAETAAAAIQEGEPIKVLQDLVNAGFDAKRASFVFRPEGAGPHHAVRTPLLLQACRWRDAAAAEFLVAQGCDPRQADGLGWLPIQTAAGAGSLPIVRLLVDRCGVPPRPGGERHGGAAPHGGDGPERGGGLSEGAWGGPDARAPDGPARAGGCGLVAGGGAEGGGGGDPGGARGGGSDECGGSSDRASRG